MGEPHRHRYHTAPWVRHPFIPGSKTRPDSGEISDKLSSDESDDSSAYWDDGASSPPPTCAICLRKCRFKCGTNACIHEFCYKCLFGWSKVKRECPLCKKVFRNILRTSSTSNHDDDYFLLARHTCCQAAHQNRSTLGIIIEEATAAKQESNEGRQEASAQNPNQGPSNGQANGHSSQSANAHSSQQAGSAQAQQSRQNGRANQAAEVPEPLDTEQLLELYRQETSRGNTDDQHSLSQRWRKHVYKEQLYSVAMRDPKGKSHPCSAKFYKENPSEIERLLPFIHRDILCLLRSNPDVIPTAETRIAALLVECNILTPRFRRRVQPFIGIKTIQFVHELNNFARSPLTMNDYDHTVQYLKNLADEKMISSETSSDSDVESVHEVEIPPSITIYGEKTTTRATQFTPSPSPNVCITLDDDDDDGPSTSSAARARMAAIESAERAASETAKESEKQAEKPAPPPAQPSTSAQAENGESSSDECEYVAIPPPPITTIDSDTDSDVMIITDSTVTHVPFLILEERVSPTTRIRNTLRAMRKRQASCEQENKAIKKAQQANSFIPIAGEPSTSSGIRRRQRPQRNDELQDSDSSFASYTGPSTSRAVTKLVMRSRRQRDAMRQAKLGDVKPIFSTVQRAGDSDDSD